MHLKVDSIISIAQQLIKALETLHYSGYTHNDIKPENIMLDTVGEDQYHATLIDYGFTTKYCIESRHIKM